MLNFDIAFTRESVDGDPSVAMGLIQFGTHQESFQSVTGFWSVDAYRASWIAALRRLADGAEVSCLLTSVPDPSKAEFFIAWPLYRSGDDIYVQNELIFTDELDREFNPNAPWEFVGARVTVDEDGNHISEWRVSRTDIEEFVTRETR